jgi:uncharacterized membrane protein
MEGATKDNESAHGNFSSAEIGAIAHLYRGEVYRSTAWRSRLDNTTNWSVVTIGVALSLSYSSPGASPLPLILVALLVLVFLLLEARRYRYFNVWRARCRLLETDFFAPLLEGQGAVRNAKWNDLLANDYKLPRFHVSYALAMGRRIRKNYCYIFLIQAVAYAGKLVIHPTPLTGFAQLYERAAIGPVSGQVVLIVGLLFHSSWALLALLTLRNEQKYRRRKALISIG